MTYVPKALEQPSQLAAVNLAAHIGFATILANDTEGLTVAHAPVFVDNKHGSCDLRFHLAAHNPLAATLGLSPSGLAIFRGPDGYISPEWYDHENVPTWDYAFVHMTGAVEVLSASELRLHLDELIERNEPGLHAREDFIDSYLSHIQGFIMRDPNIEPIFKLSQDKSDKSIQGVVGGLRDRGQWLDVELAELIAWQRSQGDNRTT